VSDDTVSMGEIAERIGRTLAAVDHWVRGRRGPGDFPAPRVPRDRAALWSWAEVSAWLVANGLAEIPPEEIETARVCHAVDMVLRARQQMSTEGWRRILTVASTAA
jgi:predicted DNA-binding transcriptional regulator AlpA